MAVFWFVASCSLIEVYHITRRYNPEDNHLHLNTSLIHTFRTLVSVFVTVRCLRIKYVDVEVTLFINNLKIRSNLST
jgi:hypothetical protein